MKFERADRRRLVFASALTAIALPATWLANEDDTGERSAAPNVAAVGVDAERAVGQRAATVVPVSDDPLTPSWDTTPPRFLDGPTVGSPEQVVVARPADDGQSVVMDATFRRSVSRGSCEVNRVPGGSEATVVNLENGRSVECVTTPLASGSLEEVVLHPDDFQAIADVTDVPAHVEISW